MRMLNGRLLHFDIGDFLLSSDLLSVQDAHKDCNTPCNYLLTTAYSTCQFADFRAQIAFYEEQRRAAG
jgi:hypothetical protein